MYYFLIHVVLDFFTTFKLYVYLSLLYCFLNVIILFLDFSQQSSYHGLCGNCFRLFFTFVFSFLKGTPWDENF